MNGDCSSLISFKFQITGSNHGAHPCERLASFGRIPGQGVARIGKFHRIGAGRR